MNIDRENTLLARQANYYASLGTDDIPGGVMEKARRVLMDFLCETAAGYKEGELASISIDYLKETGGGQEATILCDGTKLPAPWTALAMGIMAHSIELDDGHRWGTSHPAVAVIPAVLAMGEKSGSSFSEILKGIVIGYDAMLRAARAINPSHLKRGFHSTGTCGAIGAAAGCASIAGLPSDKFAYAMSMGGLQSAGLQEMLHDHPGIKPLQPGKAALAGVLSTELALRGAKSPRTLFEGQHGWLKAMCDGEYSEEGLMGDLGTRWEILLTYTKLYPTCRHCHAAIDLAREAKKTLECTERDVESIKIRTYRLGIVEVGQVFLPSNFEEAMFSMPFSLALALRTGNVTLQDYTPELLADEELRRVASAVTIEEDERMNALYPEERGAWMSLVLKDGRTFEKGIPVAKGEPENPVIDRDLMEKLTAMLAPYYPEEFVTGLWKICVESDVEAVAYGDILDHFGRFHKP
ncbi:MAG: MmgE/PrpD family protein [Synergistaceae bacterium]|nr:MmgE/PrpD family protein [Synergistota bacterium]NLM72100.1 MmgE/PrpD family protein [Synergistaceae bacterium]